jgi:hypothetical protein
MWFPRRSVAPSMAAALGYSAGRPPGVAPLCCRPLMSIGSRHRPGEKAGERGRLVGSTDLRGPAYQRNVRQPAHGKPCADHQSRSRRPPDCCAHFRCRRRPWAHCRCRSSNPTLSAWPSCGKPHQPLSAESNTPIFASGAFRRYRPFGGHRPALCAPGEAVESGGVVSSAHPPRYRWRLDPDRIGAAEMSEGNRLP